MKLEVVDYQHVVHYRAGQLLTMLKNLNRLMKKDRIAAKSADWKNKCEDDVQLHGVAVTEAHICAYLTCRPHSLHFIVLLDVVPSWVTVPTPREMRDFLQQVRNGHRVSLPHTSVFFLPTALVCMNFVRLSLLDDNPQNEIIENGSTDLSLLCITECGHLLTTTYYDSFFQWRIVSNSLNLRSIHQPPDRHCWVDTAEFHSPSRTVLWVEVESIIPSVTQQPGHFTAKTINNVFAVCLPKKMFRHESEDSDDSFIKSRCHRSSCMSGSYAVVNTLDVLYKKNTVLCHHLVRGLSFQIIKLKKSERGCWVLICDLSNQALLVQYFDFRLGRQTVLKEVKEMGLFISDPSKISMTLLETAEQTCSKNVVSSVLIVVCLDDDSNSILATVATCNDGNVHLSKARQLNIFDLLPGRNSPFNTSKIQSVTSFGCVLVIVVPNFIAYSLMSPILSQSCDDKMLDNIVWNYLTFEGTSNVGYWLSQYGDAEPTATQFRGPSPSLFGFYDSSGSMFNVVVKDDFNASSMKSSTANYYNLLMSNNLEFSGRESWLFHWCQNGDEAIIPPHSYLLSESNWSKAISGHRHNKHCGHTFSSNFGKYLFEVIFNSHDSLICHCCQKCRCGHIFPSCYELGESTVDDAMLSRLLSDNFVSAPQHTSQDNGQCSISCQERLNRFFASSLPHKEYKHRPFDVNSFVASIEMSGCGDGNGYLEDALSFLLDCRGSDDSASLLDFTIVVLSLAFSLVRCDAHKCSCLHVNDLDSDEKEKKSKLCVCRDREPNVAYVSLRRCLLAVLLSLSKYDSVVSNAPDQLRDLSSAVHCRTYHWGSYQYCDRILCDIFGISNPLPKSCSFPVNRELSKLPVGYQDLLMQLVAFCGDILGVLYLLVLFLRFEELVEVGGYLLDNYTKESEQFSPQLMREVSSRYSHSCKNPCFTNCKVCESQLNVEGSDDLSLDDEDLGDTWITRDGLDDDSTTDASSNEQGKAGEENKPTSSQVNSTSSTTAYIATHYADIFRTILFACICMGNASLSKRFVSSCNWSQYFGSDNNEHDGKMKLEIIRAVVKDAKEWRSCLAVNARDLHFFQCYKSELSVSDIIAA